MKSAIKVIALLALSLLFVLPALAGRHDVMPQAPAFGGLRGTHQGAEQLNAAQHLKNHADVTITATATAVPLCGGANLNRVTARISNTGATNTIRAGDSTTDNTHGVIIAANSSVEFETTDDVYAYSQAGSTANCEEVTR